MKRYLDVFEGIRLPTDYASMQKYVVLAQSDAGKTYLTLKFEEQLCDAGLFFVTLDPVGKHWALRAGKDGSPEGGKQGVYVLGGQHGDVPLDPESGALIADVVVDHPGQYVIDLSTFDTNADQDRFATAFALRLFRRKAKDPGFPLTLILEEAEDFIPQVPQSDQKKMKGAFSRIQKIGRNNGLGTWAVSQRSASLDKGFISQGSVLIAMRMSHKRDRDAIDDWVEANGTQEQRDKLMSEIASYDQGECTVWSPAWLKEFKHTRVLERETFDSSASVKAGGRMQAVELVPLDVEALGESIKSIAKKAEGEDPKKLRRHIEELERDLRVAREEVEDFGAAKDAVRELEERLTKTEGATRALEPDDIDAIAGLAAEATNLVAEVRIIRELAEGRGSSPGHDEAGDESKIERLRESAWSPRPSKRVSPPPDVPTEPFDNGELSSSERDLLSAYIAAGRPLEPVELGVLTAKQVNAGPVRGAMNKLVQRGYVYEGQATTDAPEIEPLDISPRAIQDRWRARLKGNQLQVFELALREYPRWVSPAEIGQAIGKNPDAGPIRGAFNKVAQLGVIAYHREQGVRASDYLVRG